MDIFIHPHALTKQTNSHSHFISIIKCFLRWKLEIIMRVWVRYYAFKIFQLIADKKSMKKMVKERNVLVDNGFGHSECQNSGKIVAISGVDVGVFI